MKLSSSNIVRVKINLGEFTFINRKITLYRIAKIEIENFQYKNNKRSFLKY